MYGLDIDDSAFDRPAVGRMTPRKVISSPASEAYIPSFQKRRNMINILTQQARLENEKHRKPCKTCGNLVKPELQRQHNAAYHAS